MVLNKNNIMKITTIMIILLVIALIFIFMHYLSFRDDVVVKKPVTTPIKTNSGEIKNLERSGESKVETIESGETSLIPSNPEDNNSESKVEDKGSKDNKDNNDKIQKEDEAPKNNKTSDENKNENKNENNNSKGNEDNSTQMPNTIIDVTDNNMQEPVITSDINTSNQEKQQVLNELDDALKGLLEVVGKVPTVDENKLDASLESEVQP